MNVASGKRVVVITRGSEILIDNERLAVCGVELLSVSCTTKLDDPEAVGIPLRIPSGERFMPAGRDPETTHQREPDRRLQLDVAEPYGGVPPEACKTTSV